MTDTTTQVGRFAPSPTGRMHLGNVFTALISYLLVKSCHGRWILRIEDLDPQRSRHDYARLIEDDLNWLGLEPDEGGIDGYGPHAPYCQSGRSRLYQDAADKLIATGFVYPCICSKADILAVAAPHSSDKRLIYPGTCRPNEPIPFSPPAAPHSLRLIVPDRDITFTDNIFGKTSTNLAKECGDFVLRRSDGAWAYQLAVVVDDNDMGVNQVVRGCDLLESTAQQIYLYTLLGITPPKYYHLPLICNMQGRRLSKRDPELDMAHLRQRFTSRQLIAHIAHIAGILDSPLPCSPAELLDIFDINKLPRTKNININICQLK